MKMIDLVDVGTLTKAEAEKQISAGWTEGVVYRGMNVFDTLYDNGSIWVATEKFLPESNQECYLGYIAEQDRFVVGFDTWPVEDEHCDGCNCSVSEEGSASVLSFTLTLQGKIENMQPVSGMESMFYSYNWKKLKELHPSLYDIRLD